MRSRVETVIVVEDEMELRCLIEDILQSEGYSYLSFPSPHGALLELTSGSVYRDLSQGRPFIVLSDHLMKGGMSGLDFLKTLKSRFPKMPFILTTAFGSESVESEARQLGACSVLRKPFSIADLIEHLRRAATPSYFQIPFEAKLMALI